MCALGWDTAAWSSLCSLHQIKVRSRDRIAGRARLNPACVYLDIAVGWKVNSGRTANAHGQRNLKPAGP